MPANMTYRDWQKSYVECDKTGLQEAKKDDTINSMDITNEWIKTNGIKGTVTEKQEYTVNDMIYKVDGKHVILRPTAQEKEIAAIMKGGEILKVYGRK